MYQYKGTQQASKSWRTHMISADFMSLKPSDPMDLMFLCDLYDVMWWNFPSCIVAVRDIEVNCVTAEGRAKNYKHYQTLTTYIKYIYIEIRCLRVFFPVRDIKTIFHIIFMITRELNRTQISCCSESWALSSKLRQRLLQLLMPKWQQNLVRWCRGPPKNHWDMWWKDWTAV